MAISKYSKGYWIEKVRADDGCINWIVHTEMPEKSYNELETEIETIKVERDRYKVIVQDMANSLCAQAFQTGRPGKCGECDSCRARAVLNLFE